MTLNTELLMAFFAASSRLMEVAALNGLPHKNAAQVHAWAESHREDASELLVGVERLWLRLWAIRGVVGSRWIESEPHCEALPHLTNVLQNVMGLLPVRVPGFGAILGLVDRPTGQEISGGIGRDLFTRMHNYRLWQNDAYILAHCRNHYISALDEVQNPEARFLAYVLYMFEAIYGSYINGRVLPLEQRMPWPQGWLIAPLEEVLLTMIRSAGEDEQLDRLLGLMMTLPGDGLGWVNLRQLERVNALPAKA